MIQQLKQLYSILNEFVVRVDENGRVLSEPDCNKNQYACHMEREEAWCECSAYNQAKQVVLMPRVMVFDEATDAYLTKEQDKGLPTDVFVELYHAYSRRYVYFAKPQPQLWQYVPCDEGKPLEKPENYESFLAERPHDIYSSPDTNDWVDRCKAYETAKAKTIFYGWEYDQNFGKHVQIKNKLGEAIIFYTSGMVESWTSENDFDRVLQTLEDAFIACPHYVELNKIK